MLKKKNSLKTLWDSIKKSAGPLELPKEVDVTQKTFAETSG